MSSDPNLPPEQPYRPVPPLGDPNAPLAPAATSTGLAPNVAAGLSAFFLLLGGLVFIFIEKRNQFVRFWAMQSIFFGGAWFLFNIASGIIGFVLYHILWILGKTWGVFSVVVGLVFLAFWIVGLFKAFTGQTWEYPVVGKMAREQLARTPLV